MLLAAPGQKALLEDRFLSRSLLDSGTADESNAPLLLHLSRALLQLKERWLRLGHKLSGANSKLRVVVACLNAWETYSYFICLRICFIFPS